MYRQIKILNDTLKQCCENEKLAGAVRNNPETVAYAYKKILSDFMKYFREIRFAVYCSSGHSKNYDTFCEIIGNSD